MDKPELTPLQFKQLLESQVRFAHLKHDLIADCAFIDNLFDPNNADTYPSFDDLILNYDAIYISGGYFFKYSANNPFARILPDYFKDFAKEQKIDVYSRLLPQVKNGSDVLTTFKQKYSVPSNQEQSPVFTKTFQHRIPGVTFTINYWNDPYKRPPVNYYFDAEFCNVEYRINKKVFIVSDWFNSNNDIDNAELFPANIDKERKLKFKMKGLYNLNDEMDIRSAVLHLKAFKR